MMRPLSRNIQYNHTPIYGDVYYLQEGGHTIARYGKLSEVLLARKKRDWKKSLWVEYYNGYKEAHGDWNSRIKLYRPTGKWYVQCELPDFELIVTQQYSKNDAVFLKEYLDKHNWKINYVNEQKLMGIESIRKYAGILPIKGGYLLVDAENNEHGVYDTLEEAIEYREFLRKGGTII